MTNEKEIFQSIYKKEQLKEFDLPDEIKNTYRIISCLKCSQEKQTLLLQRNSSGEKFILKIASGKSGEYLACEEKTLKKLTDRNVPFLPKPVMTLEGNHKVYFLRDYIEGYTPMDVVEITGGYDEQELIKLGIKLCDTVLSLHTMDEPVIHRDIKPENIIVTPDGAVSLIDYETVRTFSDKKDTDTVFMGTSTTAAPEQYGYAQTDVRTDIYAMGMTMLYLASGDYSREEFMNTHYSAKVKKIILKCCSFDPEERYQNVVCLKKALISCTITARRRRDICCLAGIFSCLLLSILLLHFYTIYRDRKSQAAANSKVVFDNSLLEQEIRSELGIDYGTPVTYRDLENVHRIAIVGYEMVKRDADFAYRDGTYINDVNIEGNGYISDLSLLQYMPNLNELILCQQNISDLKPLQGLPIIKLALADNNISDLSVLAGLTSLEELYIGNNPASDLSPVGGCKNLQFLNIDSMTVKNINFLDKLSLNSLSVCFVKLTDGTWDPVALQKKLRHFYTADLTSEQAAAVNQLTDLEEFASWWNSKLTDLTELNGLTNLHTLILLNGFKSLDGIDKMPHLRDLFIGYNDISDISPIEALPELETLGLDNTNIKDFAVLFHCPSLKLVRQVSKTQKLKILEINPQPDFEISYD